MAWPTPQDFNEAVQSPATSFTDPELKSGKVETDKLGLPRPISGRFAVVYNIRCGSRNYAIRCFQSYVPDQQERYAAISAHLKKSHLPYTVGFDFLPEGIRIRGQWYPLLKMEWIAGQPLHTYVENHLRDSAALIRLATNWITMTEALQKVSLAHGDLQDGNVLMAGDNLKLIDYDGMFVPALAGKMSNESGHRNYQHPNRSALDYGLFLDNFSNWVIYVSLVSLAIDPSLWTRLKGGDECLLFRKSDFLPNSGSQAMAALSQHNDPRLRALASIFESLLYLLPAQVPALATNAAVDPSTLRQQSPPSASNSPGPSWLNDHVKQPSQTNKEAVKAPSLFPSETALSPATSPTWILDFITPVTARKTFEQPLLKLRVILATLVLLALTLPLLRSVSADLIGECILITLIGTLPFLFYRREPAAQERYVCLAQEREQQVALVKLQSRIRDQGQKVTQLRADEKKANVALEQERKLIQQNEQQSQQRASAELKTKMDALTLRQQQITRPLQKRQTDHQMSIGRLNQQIADCNQRQVQEINTALQPLQRQFVQDYLRSARIDTAHISGIGQKMAANLRASGYTTAADVTWDVQSVSGIGSSKGSALMGWRQVIETEARQKMPTTLSKIQSNAIIDKYEVQRRGFQQAAEAAKIQFAVQERALKQQDASAVAAIESERTALQQRFGQQTQSIAAQFQPQHSLSSQKEAAITAEYSKKMEEVEKQTGEVRKSIYNQNWQLAKARQELEVYQSVTFAAFLAAILRVGRIKNFKS